MEGTLPPPRTPDQTDLVRLCTALNDRGERYMVVGGMAIIQHGFLRDKDIPDRLFLERKLRDSST
jgi:hypothetical protein